MNRKLVTGLAVFFLSGSIFSSHSFAAAGQTYQNPPAQEINRLLTEAAISKDIPPEIAKALAFKESTWKQFDDNGAPNVSSDGGIGIMQVTNDSRFDQEKLKTDIAYNINAGLQKLNEKFTAVDGILPVLNKNERDILENWYFAILAYNGTVQSNSPIVKATGVRNTASYQEELYSELNQNNNYMGIYPIPFQFQASDFTYTGEPNYLLRFNKLNYQIPYQLLHRTKHNFSINDIVVSDSGATFRTAPSTLAKAVKTLPAGTREAITILNKFVYDESYKFNASVDMRYKQYVWYKVGLKNDQVGYAASGALTPLGKRISGLDRYQTAVEISKQGWANGSNTVIIANGTDFPDALAGTPLAYQLNAPILLNSGNTLKPATKTEITRLKATKAILLGETGAVSDGVKKQLTAMGLQVDRYGGATRMDTAIKIADHIPNKGKTAILAFGYNFPDALAIAPYAAKMGYPIFLAKQNELSVATKKALKGYDRTIVVGSEGVISQTVYNQLNKPVRYGGTTRFDTNYQIVNALFNSENGKAYLATGSNFADALTGAVLAAKNDAPLLLTYPKTVPDPIKQAILNKKLNYYYFLGGSSVVGVENEIANIIQMIKY